MRKYVPVTLSLALAMPIFACGGNNEGNNTNTDTQCHGANCGHESTDSDPSKNKESTITKINQGLIQLKKEITISEAVITGIPTTKWTDNTTNESKYVIKGVYVSDVIDQAKPYTGIYVYFGNNPVDKGTYAIGDIVSIKGVVDHYVPQGGKIGNRQIANAVLTKKSTGKVPAPAVVDASAIGTKFDYNEAGGYWAPGTHAAESDKYNGVYVKIKGTTEATNVIKSLKSNCENKDATPVADACLASTGVELNNNVVLARNGGMYTVNDSLLVKGTKFTTAAGILSISYDAYVLNPTAGADIQKEGGSSDDDGRSDREYAETAIDDIQAGEIADNTFVKVDGVVVSHTSAPFENSLSFYIADEDGNAIFVYSANSEGVTGIEKGKKVTVTGSIAKFTSNKGEKMTQMEVKGAGKPAITVNGSGEEKVIEMTLPVNESSRGKLATFKDLTVKEAADDYCNGGTATNYCTATLTDGTNDIKVKYLKIDDNDKDYSNLKKLIGDNFSTQNDVFSSVTGILDVSYGDIVLFPRTQDDIVKAPLE